MTKEQAINYLYSSGFSEEQINTIVQAFEPTTKNDLGVECISRDSAIKALDYDINSFEFKSGVSKYMNDIAKLLNTIYEIQVNNIKALPSVTPQDIDYKAQYERLSQKAEIVISQLRADRDRLMSLTSVTPQEPKTGHWYRQTNDYVDYYECSECGMAMGLYDVKSYCPNCGSRNEVEE
jgi:rubrerythrin